MFNKDGDFYFIAYNAILILHHLNCYKGKSNFYDYRKLIYILPFIADRSLLKSVTENKRIRQEQIRVLEDIYINSRLREPILKSILFTLEKKGYLELEKNTSRKCIDVKLKKNSIPKEYLNSELFKMESENIREFKNSFKRLSFITIESMLDKLFKEKGVLVWDV
ncbi:hypothetical protein [Bacillus cereus]|uniref:hypothetical protein n=1 Tax=Bacillus cereus TaxID=1396 RepID=UPI001C3F3FC6|nr:hypothetical protein [Bacillus cereus]